MSRKQTNHRSTTMSKQTVYLFDFDGTLTTRDTMLTFIRYTHGTVAFICGFLRHLPMLVKMKIGIYPNGKAKERIFSHFYKNVPTETMNRWGSCFAADNRHLVRPKGLRILQEARKEGATILIVSASIDLWVRPFFDLLLTKTTEPKGDFHVVCTQAEEKDGRITGRFSTPNCHGAEKVRRIEALLDKRESYHIIAFGDSRGDDEMLKYADEGHFKPFR